MIEVDTETALDRWDEFVDEHSLPYYKNAHRLMMRQILDRFPFGKVVDLSDRDIVETVNEDSVRSLKFFMSHLDRFLKYHDMERDPR